MARLRLRRGREESSRERRLPALLAFVAVRGAGTVLFAPLKVRLWPGKFREPDLVFLSAEHASRIGESFWEGPTW